MFFSRSVVYISFGFLCFLGNNIMLGSCIREVCIREENVFKYFVRVLF